MQTPRDENNASAGNSRLSDSVKQMDANLHCLSFEATADYSAPRNTRLVRQLKHRSTPVPKAVRVFEVLGSPRSLRLAANAKQRHSFNASLSHSILVQVVEEHFTAEATVGKCSTGTQCDSPIPLVEEIIKLYLNFLIALSLLCFSFTFVCVFLVTPIGGSLSICPLMSKATYPVTTLLRKSRWKLTSKFHFCCFSGLRISVSF